MRDDGGIRCDEVLAALSDYLAGGLAPEVVGRVESHLQSCPDCERFGAGFGAMVVELAQGDAPTAPRHLLAGVLRRLEE